MVKHLLKFDMEEFLCISRMLFSVRIFQAVLKTPEENYEGSRRASMCCWTYIGHWGTQDWSGKYRASKRLKESVVILIF